MDFIDYDNIIINLIIMEIPNENEFFCWYFFIHHKLISEDVSASYLAIDLI
jgi:hypothetical protein